MTMINVRAVYTVSALAIVAASVTACGDFAAPTINSGIGRAMPQITISCQTGYISLDRDGHAAFKPGEHSDADFYLVRFTNKNGSRTGQVSDLGITFYSASGANVGSDAPTFAVSVAPRHSVSVIFYGPDSGFSKIGNPAPVGWESDGHMPSGATRCHVYTWTVTSRSRAASPAYLPLGSGAGV